MTKNEYTVMKANMLGAMNEIMRNLNDEDYIEPWLMCGVPDGADETDLMEIAEDETEFEYITELFLKLKREADNDFYFKDEK